MADIERGHYIDCDKECGAHDALVISISEMRGAVMAVAWVVGVFGCLFLGLFGYAYVSLVGSDKDLDQKLDQIVAKQNELDSGQKIIELHVKRLSKDNSIFTP